MHPGGGADLPFAQDSRIAAIVEYPPASPPRDFRASASALEVGVSCVTLALRQPGPLDEEVGVRKAFGWNGPRMQSSTGHAIWTEINLCRVARARSKIWSWQRPVG